MQRKPILWFLIFASLRLAVDAPPHAVLPAQEPTPPRPPPRPMHCWTNLKPTITSVTSEERWRSARLLCPSTNNWATWQGRL